MYRAHRRFAGPMRMSAMQVKKRIAFSYPGIPVSERSYLGGRLQTSH
jgi:hypothetical protein